MSPIELRSILRNVLSEMTQEDVADMLMLAPRTMRRWLKGDARVDGSSTALLRLLRSKRIKLRDVERALAQSPGGSS